MANNVAGSATSWWLSTPSAAGLSALGRRTGEHQWPWWVLDQNGCKPLAKMLFCFFPSVNHRKWSEMKIKLNKEGRMAGMSNQVVASNPLHYLSGHIFSWLFHIFIVLSILQPHLYLPDLTEHPRSSWKLPSWKCLKSRSLWISYLSCSSVCIQTELLCSTLPLIVSSRCTHFRSIEKWITRTGVSNLISNVWLSWQETKHEKKINPSMTSFSGTTKF